MQDTTALSSVSAGAGWFETMFSIMRSFEIRTIVREQWLLEVGFAVQFHEVQNAAAVEELATGYALADGQAQRLG